MKSTRRRFAAAAATIAAIALFAPSVARAQQPAAQRLPHIGYVYPAGGRAASSFEVIVGGQFLDGVSAARVCGSDVQATVIEHVKPLTPQQAMQLRDRLKELTDRKALSLTSSSTRPAWSDADENKLTEIRERLASFVRKPSSAAIAETVRRKVTIAKGAEIGDRELRLRTPTGLTNPLVFCVGQFPEFSEEPGRSSGEVVASVAKKQKLITLPAVVNGQILPGGANRYEFEARRGQHLVITAAARSLMPYIADAVPGWFQATLALYDRSGREVAYDDDFRFSPDPVLYYVVPKDDRYTLEIKDAIYRGREDFVYRITVGEVPFVTSIFPLGGRVGEDVSVTLSGWNLPMQQSKQRLLDEQAGVLSFVAKKGTWSANAKPFIADTLPETTEAEPNDRLQDAQSVHLPIIINGRIGRATDADVYAFSGKKGDRVTAEVLARRLDSPLDSIVELTDELGTRVASNDDHEDKGAALLTHQADSLLDLSLPHDGTYFFHVADAQGKGGPEYGYRLRISAPRPDFELRVVPSSVNVRAGGTAALTVYAMRHDGFDGEIALSLADAPDGLSLSGAAVPRGQDQVRLTLTSTSASASSEPFRVRMIGRARIGAINVSRAAVPAEDMMQAFAYRHLVPAKELLVSVVGKPMSRVLGGGLAVLDDEPLTIRPGGIARIRISTAAAAAPRGAELHFEVIEPTGISIRSIVPRREQTELVVVCDKEKLATGASGNLIVEAFAERPAAPTTQTAKSAAVPMRRYSLGLLPAIPFEVIGPTSRRSRGVANAN